jgi:hypothetical protein
MASIFFFAITVGLAFPLAFLIDCSHFRNWNFDHFIFNRSKIVAHTILLFVPLHMACGIMRRPNEPSNLQLGEFPVIFQAV